MSYDTLVRALPGLKAYWPLDETSGTSLRDVINSQALTVNTGAAVNGTTSPPAGFAAYASILGTNATAISRNYTAGSALDVQACTLAGLVRVSSFPPSGTPQLAASLNGLQMSLLNGGSWRLSASTTISQPTGQPNTTQTSFGLPLNEWLLLAATYSQFTGEVRCYLNGVLTSVFTKLGPLTTGASSFYLGGSGTGIVADLSGWFMCDRPIGSSALIDLAKNASGVTVPTFKSFADLDNPLASTPSAGIAGGHMDQTDGRVTIPDGSVHRIDEYAASVMRRPAGFPTIADASQTVPDLAAKLISELAVMNAQRGHTVDTSYHDGTIYRYPGSSGSFLRSALGQAPALALVHRAMRLGKRSWLVQQVRDVVEYAWTTQAVDGGLLDSPSTPSTTFASVSIGTAMLALRDTLDASTWARWSANLEKTGTYIYNATANAFYVNGNIELQNAVALYQIYLVTGKQTWLDAFNAQWTKTVAPTDAISSANGPAGTAGFGLKDGTTGALVDIATLTNTSKAYLAESNNPGTVGLDWDYLGVAQLWNAQLLYLLSGNATHLKLVNVLLNKAMERMQLLATPVANTPSTATTGGTLPANTYYYVVTALNGAGETVKSNEVSVTTTGSTSTVTVTWAAVTNATSYRIYRGTAAGAQSVFYVGSGTSFTDTNAASTAGTPPAASTAYQWTYDATGGTRHNLVESFWSPSIGMLQWKGIRPDLAAIDVSAQWTKVRGDFRGSQGSTNENFWSTGLPLGLWVMSGANWPGLP